MTARIAAWCTGDWAGLESLRVALAAATELPDRPEDADVVLLATSADTIPADAIAAVREHTRAPILLLATQRSADLLQGTVEADVADVLLLPQPAESVLFAAEKALRARTTTAAKDGAETRVVTVFSPKGGTGKSVTACNVAAALADAGRRVLLLDLDVQFGDAAIMLGLEPERTLFDVVTAPGVLDAEKLAAYATRHPSGMHVLPAPLRPEDAELVSDAKVSAVLEAAAGAYDAVVVDTAPFFHESALAALDRTDDLLLLMTPDVPTLKNVRLALQTLELLAFPPEKVRFVLNRASARIGFKAGAVGAVLDRPVDFELPEDDIVSIGVNKGVPAVLLRRDSDYAIAAHALGEALLAGMQPSAPTRRRRRFRLLGALR